MHFFLVNSISPLLATWTDRFPGIAFALPLLAAASVVFAATHHEDPVAIWKATLQWVVWMGGTLGLVLVAVIALAAIV